MMPQSIAHLPIKTARLQIRQFSQADIEPFVHFMTDRESTQFLTFGEEQKTAAGAKELIQMTIGSYNSATPMLAFAVEEQATRTFVGFCGLTPHDNETVEIMYAIMPSARRQGFATEVAAQLARYALDELGYLRVTAPIVPTHEYSKAVVKKAGFKDCGLAQSINRVHQFVLEQTATT